MTRQPMSSSSSSRRRPQRRFHDPSSRSLRSRLSRCSRSGAGMSRALVSRIGGALRMVAVGAARRPDRRRLGCRSRERSLDDRAQRPRFLIHDRDTKFSRAVDAIFHGEGMKVIRTPVRAPNANAHIERWVGSARRECLDRLLIFDRCQLEHVLPGLCPPLQRTAPTPRTRLASTRSAVQAALDAI